MKTNRIVYGVLVVAEIGVGAYAMECGRWDIAAVAGIAALFMYVYAKLNRIEARIGAAARETDRRIDKLGDIVLLDAETEDAADLEMARERMKEPGIPWEDVKRELGLNG